jgi:peptide-methionine (S)-S-oxide reductase
MINTMKTTRKRFGLVLALALLAQFALGGGAPRPAAAATTQQLVLGGGCFWGVEAVFKALAGVTATMPGYSGGAASTAHYEDVSTGTTGHAESVRITYDPAKISLQQLLDVYFLVAHDPTELNRQGPDDGSQYRSVIFVANADQRDAAQAEIARLTAEHKFSAPIVTKLEPFKAFFPAEEYHRNYLATHLDSPYIIYNDLPKLAALKKTYPQLVAQK